MSNKKIDTDSIMAILEIGVDTIDRMGNIIDDINDSKKNFKNNGSMIDTINKIFDKIDYEDLKKIKERESNSGFSLKNLFNKAQSSVKKTMEKFVNIVDELENMKLTFKDWEAEIKMSTNILDKYRKELSDIIDVLNEYIQICREEMENMKMEDSYDEQKYNALSEKIQSLQYSIGVCMENVKMIELMFSTNINLIKKIHESYSTTLPQLKSLINNFEMIKDNKTKIETLRIIDDKRNQLLEFGTKEMIETAKDSVDSIGYNTEDFEILEKSIRDATEGLNEVARLYSNKVKQISGSVERMKLLENKSNIEMSD